MKTHVFVILCAIGIIQISHSQVLSNGLGNLGNSFSSSNIAGNSIVSNNIGINSLSNNANFGSNNANFGLNNANFGSNNQGLANLANSIGNSLSNANVVGNSVVSNNIGIGNLGANNIGVNTIGVNNIGANNIGAFNIGAKNLALGNSAGSIASSIGSSLATNSVTSNFAANKGFLSGNAGFGAVGNTIGLSQANIGEVVEVSVGNGYHGDLPVIGYVTFEGYIPADGIVSVANNACDCNSK